MPSMSPRTQQMQMAGNAGADQATDAFEKGFSDMAYGVLLSKFPDVAQDVVTFKILDTDLDKGMGIGAFVVMRGGQPLYIPAVLSDNVMKPLDMVYHKALNIFLPLSKQWLEEIDKTTMNSLGKGIKTPESLYTDVDIRSLVVPPITGRFSYAFWKPVILADVARVINTDTLEKLASEPKLVLLDVLRRAPNSIKTAFTRTLEKHPKLLKQAAAIYGVTALADVLRLHAVKTAAKQHFGGALWIADKDTTPTDFKRIFGAQAGEAYAGVRKKGFAAKDERLERNMAVQTQPYERCTEPRQPGVYILYDHAGSEKPALVMPNPIDLFAKGTRYGRRAAVPGRNPLVDNSYYDPSPFGSANRVYPEGRPDEAGFVTKQDVPEFLAVLANGDYLQCDRLAGRESVVDEISGGPLHKRLFENVSGEPARGVGFFVRQKGTTIQATAPVEIKSITTGADGVRRITASKAGGWGDEKQIITDPSHARDQIWNQGGADLSYVPADFVWVPLKQRLEKRDFFTSPHDLARHASFMLGSVGAKKVSIKDAGAGQFSIDRGVGMGKIAALKSLAIGFSLPVEAAEALLEKAASEGRATAWVVSGRQLALAQQMLDKTAAEGDDKKKDKKPSDAKDKSPSKKPPSAGASGPPGGGDPAAQGDPSMQGADDPNAQAAMMAAMQPPEPPPPAPTDLAAMEMDHHIQLEIQKLQEQQAMLAMLTQRAHEIAGGSPLTPGIQTQALGGPPPGMNLATGQPMPGPGVQPGPSMGGLGGGGMGMPPSLGGGDPSMGGAPPDMGMPPGLGGQDPSMGGAPGMPQGGPPGMAAPGGSLPMAPDPAMGGQPGMGDPSMGGQPSGQPGMPPGMPPGMGDPSMGGQPPPPPMAMMGPDGPSANGMESEINPQFLQQAGMTSPDMFDAAAVASIAQSPAVKEMIGQYLPNLEKALDNLARVQLTLAMQEPDLKADIGEMAFTSLEDNLRSTFKNLGDLVLKMSQGAHAMKGQFEHVDA